MKFVYHLVFLSACSSWTLVQAELPPQLQQRAEIHDRAMKEYDATLAAIVKADRESYLIVLGAARKREERAKRPDAVAAIDVEIKAVNAGLRAEKPPAALPADLSTYRQRYMTAPERAAQAVESNRRRTREEYLKWLDELAKYARIAKNTEVLAAIAKEQQRVRAATKDGEQEGAEAKPAPDARREACGQNGQDIAAACLAYATKHDGTYPNAIADLVKSGELDEVPVSPFSDDKRSSGYELTMPGFPGISPDCQTTVVVRCKFPGPDGKVTVGFADGRVESVPADEITATLNTGKSQPRKWSDPTGTYSTQGTLAEFVAGGVKLAKSDGKIITVPYSRLSREDLDYLRSLNVYEPK